MAPPPSYDILAPMACNTHTKAQKSTVKKDFYDNPDTSLACFIVQMVSLSIVSLRWNCLQRTIKISV